jgi:hypothetical protein
MLRRRRFHDLVERQLDLFEDDEAPLFDEARETDASWTKAGPEDSEELYGDYQLVVDAIGERLYEVREAYASSLDEAAVDDYRAAFDARAKKRFGRLAAFLE